MKNGIYRLKGKTPLPLIESQILLSLNQAAIRLFVTNRFIFYFSLLPILNGILTTIIYSPITKNRI